MKKQLSAIVIFAFAIIFILVGCSIKKAEPGIEDTPVNQNPVVTEPITIEPTPAPTPTPVYEHTALLTGLPIEDENTKRPIAVLINNLKPARPQSGLHEADIIWEVLAEGGITRLFAIFQSTAEDEMAIGPVRSNRTYFIEIADSYNAVIAHAGASNGAYAILQKQKKPYLDEIKNAGPAFWRSTDRKAPHNLYTNLANLREQMEKKSYTSEANMKGYAYQYEEGELQQAPPNALDINQLEVKFQLESYKVSYKYDEENKQYIRFVNNEQHNDKDSAHPLTAKNLVFFQTKHTVIDDEGRLDIDFTSGGEAIVITDKGLKEGKWIKAEDGMIRFTVNGEEIKFAPGKTFIHVLPTGKSIFDHVEF